MTAQLTFVHALSPLHAGVGQGSGVIDLQKPFSESPVPLGQG
jgi:CRISPR/Cas system CMR subunit Cmr4 (Cas7 group RAMP superfamily)